MEHWYSSVYSFPFSPHPHPNLSHFPASSIVVSGLLDFDHVINARQNRIELRRENLWLKTWRFIHLCCILRPFMNDKLVTWVRRLVKMFAVLDMEYKKAGILQTTFVRRSLCPLCPFATTSTNCDWEGKYTESTTLCTELTTYTSLSRTGKGKWRELVTVNLPVENIHFETLLILTILANLTGAVNSRSAQFFALNQSHVFPNWWERLA